jgi:hypothetical protein
MTLDPYYTPGWVVQQCIDSVLPFVCPVPRSILEPGAGQGAFVRPLRARYPDAHLTAVDVDPYDWPEANIQLHQDLFEAEFLFRFDLIVGNPPFSRALDFVQWSLSHAKATVFLLRQGFLSSAKRNQFFRLHRPSDVFILANRPSFKGETSDKSDYCFVCWGRPGSTNDVANLGLQRFTGTTNLHWLPAVPLAQRQ